MKKCVKLNESSLRNMIKESVKRILKEYEEYDWDDFESSNDKQAYKDFDNDISWDIKNLSDRRAMSDSMPDSLMRDEKMNTYPSREELRGYHDADFEPYNDGFEDIYGNENRDAVSDNYFSDSDYRFSHDEWADDDFFGPVNNVDRMYDPDSDLNRRFTKNESKIRRVVRESLLKEAYSDKLSYMTDALDYYANMVNSGKQLSQEQSSHVQEIYDFLNDTNSHDNYEVMTYWMPLAQNLLNGNTPESGLDNIVRESINRVLKENADYEGMDLTDQDSLIMQAEDAIYRLNDRGEDYGWRQVAEEMGFRLETLNGDDIENLRDAIEFAMASGSV